MRQRICDHLVQVPYRSTKMSNRKSRPWSVEPKKTSGAYQIHDGVMRICTVTNRSQDRDNAHLISAAPDLLAAMKSLLSEICTDEGRSDATQKTIGAARSAIAKAEGKSDAAE